MMGSLCTPHPPSSPGPTQLMIIRLSPDFPTRVPIFNLIARTGSPPLLSSLLQSSNHDDHRMFCVKFHTGTPERAGTCTHRFPFFPGVVEKFPTVRVSALLESRETREGEREKGGGQRERGRAVPPLRPRPPPEADPNSLRKTRWRV